MNLCVRVRSLRTNFIGSFYRLSTAPAEIDAEASETVLIDDSDDARAREEAIEQKRNVSRLSHAHYNLVNGRRPYDIPKSLAHITVKYNRKMYGKYGSASGINPSKFTKHCICLSTFHCIYCALYALLIACTSLYCY